MLTKASCILFGVLISILVFNISENSDKTKEFIKMDIKLDDNLLRLYLFYASVLMAKVLFMVILIGRQRFKKKIFISPEDTTIIPGAQVAQDDDIERVRRAHLNDLENIPIFLISAVVYLLTEPEYWVAANLFRIFTICRFLHTFVYAVVVIPQPSRAILWGIGYAINWFMISLNMLTYQIPGYRRKYLPGSGYKATIFIFFVWKYAYLACTPVDDLPALVPTSAINGVPSAISGVQSAMTHYYHPESLRRRAINEYGIDNALPRQNSLPAHVRPSNLHTVSRFTIPTIIAKRIPKPQRVPLSSCQIVTQSSETGLEQCCLNTFWEPATVEVSCDQVDKAHPNKEHCKYYNIMVIQCTDQDANGITTYKPNDMPPALKENKYACHMLYVDSKDELRCCKRTQVKQYHPNMLEVWGCDDPEFTDDCQWYHPDDRTKEKVVEAPETSLVSSASSLKPAIFILGLMRPEMLIFITLLYAFQSIMVIFDKPRKQITSNVSGQAIDFTMTNSQRSDKVQHIDGAVNDHKIACASQTYASNQASAFQAQALKKKANRKEKN